MFRKKRHAISRDNSLENCYAQFGANSNPSSGELLRFFTIFQKGSGIKLFSEHTILLAPGYLYLINYVFLAATETGGYIQVLPYINGQMELMYGVSSPSGLERDTFASAGFLTDQALEHEAKLEFSLAFPGKIENIDITGSISILPVATGT